MNNRKSTDTFGVLNSPYGEMTIIRESETLRIRNGHRVVAGKLDGYDAKVPDHWITPDSSDPGQVCAWNEDDDGHWWTNCGHGWTFTDGGPYDNLMQYCCYCGRPLEERKDEMV